MREPMARHRRAGAEIELTPTEFRLLHYLMVNVGVSAISVGEPADAHGNHNVASTWWDINGPTGEAATTAIEPIIVYDATSTDEGAIVYATIEGLAIATDERVDLIASRAFRFVTG